MWRPRDLSRSIQLSLVVSVIVFIGAGYLLSSQPKSRPKQGVADLTGTIVCLPHKNTNGPQTMECAYGLQAADGQYYGLRGLDQQRLISGEITVQSQVHVRGQLTGASADDKYAIAGNIQISSIEKVSK